MTLYWPADDNEIVTDAPRLHAFIIGVGDYHHLGLGVPQPATFLNGLAPLTITTPAARLIAGWLESEYQNPNKPLGSIELLLSPAEQLQRADGSGVAVADATMANVEAAFKQWYKRCDADEGNVAFFYFAGHGIHTVSQFLLPSDFGNPGEPDEWENCIDATGMQAGMYKCNAQTQLFFLDACRDAPISALTQRNPHGKALVSSSLADSVDFSAAFRAASEGRKAYGRDGEATFFSKALILCLGGVGARKAGPNWRVDTAALSAAMASVVDVLAQVENEPLSCECPAMKPVPIHFPDKPRVVVKVNFEPEDIGDEASIEVKQDGIVQSSPAGERRPWMGEVDAGDARIAVTFQNFAEEVVDDDFLPPTYELPVRR